MPLEVRTIITHCMRKIPPTLQTSYVSLGDKNLDIKVIIMSIPTHNDHLH